MDARGVRSADGRVSWTRFETLVEAAINATDPDAAAARGKVSGGPRSPSPRPRGPPSTACAGFYIRADFAAITRIDATVAYLTCVNTWRRRNKRTSTNAGPKGVLHHGRPHPRP